MNLLKQNLVMSEAEFKLIGIPNTITEFESQKLFIEALVYGTFLEKMWDINQSIIEKKTTNLKKNEKSNNDRKKI